MFWCRCPRRQSAECERGLKCTVMIKCFTLTTVVSHMHKLVTSDFVSPLFKYSVNILVINRKTRHEPHCRVFPFFAYLSHVTFYFFSCLALRSVSERINKTGGIDLILTEEKMEMYAALLCFSFPCYIKAVCLFLWLTVMLNIIWVNASLQVIPVSWKL